MKKTYYGLVNKKNNKTLGYYSKSNNDSDFANDVEIILSDNEDNRWMVESSHLAEWVRNNPTAWYNASHNTPNHNFEANDLFVIRIEVEEVISKIKVSLPSKIEVWKERAKIDKGYLLFLNDPDSYSIDWWQVKEYLDKKEK